jgi:hypothetical protein
MQVLREYKCVLIGEILDGLKVMRLRDKEKV